MKNPNEYEWHIENFDKNNASKQIQEFIINKITSGKLLSGMPIISTEEYRKMLDLNKNTLVRIYSNLRSKNWIAYVSGKNYVVADNYPGKGELPVLFEKPFSADIYTGPFNLLQDCNYAMAAVGKDYIKEADSLYTYISTAYVQQVVKRSADTQAHNLNTYKDDHLRVATHNYILSKNQMLPKLSQLAVVVGRANCLHAIFRLILAQGDVVINTSFNDQVLQNSLAVMGVVVINLNPDTPDFLDELKLRLQKQVVKAIHIRARCSYLSGNSLSHKVAIQLLKLSEHYGFAIIEEDEEYEFFYQAETYLPLVGCAGSANLIYIHPLSRVHKYAQTVRVIIAAENFIERFNEFAHATLDNRSIPTENALIQLMDNGRLAMHVDKLRNLIQEKRNHLFFLLDKHLGKYMTCNLPIAGLALLVNFRQEIDVYGLIYALMQLDIKVPFHPEQIYTGPTFRLRYGFADFKLEEDLEFITALEQILIKHYGHVK